MTCEQYVTLVTDQVRVKNVISAKDALLWQVRHVIAGILLCLLISLVDYKVIQKLSVAGLLLMDVLFIAAVVQNFNGYVRLGPAAFQTLSLTPLYLPLLGGALYALRGKKVRRLWPLLLCAGLTAVLLFVLQGVPLAAEQALGTILMLLPAGRMLDTDHGKYDRIVGIVLVLTVILSAIAIVWQGNAAKIPAEFMYQESISRSWRWSRWIGNSDAAAAAVRLGTTNVMSDGTFLGIGCGYSILLQTGFSVISCFCAGNPLGMGLPIFSYGGTGMAVYAAIIGTVLSLAAYRDITPMELCMNMN